MPNEQGEDLMRIYEGAVTVDCADAVAVSSEQNAASYFPERTAWRTASMCGSMGSG